jgi:hypothetical protein
MSDTSESKSPFNKWWFVSGGLVLVIAAALVWILVIGPGTANNNNEALPEPGNSSSTLPEEPSSSPKPTELAGGECDLDDSDQEIPTAAPDAEWVDYGPLKLPTSTTIGPASQDGAVWSCFAHTPAGALFAASYFTIGLGWNDYEAVAAAGVVANSGREQWIDKRTEQGDVTIAPGEAPAIAGFRFEAYAGTDATVQIGMRYGELERMVRVFLVWDTAAGDWKVDASKGDPTSVTNEVTSIANFTPWGVTYG